MQLAAQPDSSIKTRRFRLPESLSPQLRGGTAAFDVVCCWDVLEQVDDWQALVGEMARVLRSGGVFFYSISRRAKRRGRFLSRLTRRWLEHRNEVISARELHATLRRQGLAPQRMVGLGRGLNRPAMSRALRDGLVSYNGIRISPAGLPGVADRGSVELQVDAGTVGLRSGRAGTG
jgi:SAM-dependent methyltransferase